MNTGQWLAGPYPLPATWVHTSLPEKCFSLGIILLPYLTQALDSFPVYFLPGPRKSSDYGLDQWPGQEIGIRDEMPSGLVTNDCNFRNERSPTVPEGAGIRQSSTL